MATLRVRYKFGDTDEWELHNQVDLDGFLLAMLNAVARGSGLNFGVVPRSGEAYEYGTAFVRFSEVIMSEVDCVMDTGQVAALWPTDPEDG